MPKNHRRLTRLFPLAALLLALPVAAKTYKDESAGFMLDLPPTYRFDQRQAGVMHLFNGDGGSLFLIFRDGGPKDIAGAFKEAKGLMKNTLKEATQKGKELDMEVNGQPARWCAYKGSLTLKGLTVQTYFQVGAIVLEPGNLYFLAPVMRDEKEDRAFWVNQLRKSFRTIRNVGEPEEGVSHERRPDH